MAAPCSQESDHRSPGAKRPHNDHPARGDTHPAEAAIDALQVDVKQALNGETVCTLEVGQSATIFSVKEALHEVTGIPTDHQKLLHEGQTCEENQLIKEIAARDAKCECIVPGAPTTLNQLVHLTLYQLPVVFSKADAEARRKESYNPLRRQPGLHNALRAHLQEAAEVSEKIQALAEDISLHLRQHR
jgi:hypothetical protein